MKLRSFEREEIKYDSQSFTKFCGLLTFQPENHKPLLLGEDECIQIGEGPLIIHIEPRQLDVVLRKCPITKLSQTMV